MRRIDAGLDGRDDVVAQIGFAVDITEAVPGFLANASALIGVNFVEDPSCKVLGVTDLAHGSATE